jgi:hypothetical protein
MSRSWGVILLSIYLILVGILALTNVTIAFAGAVLGVLAIAAGLCLLLGK